MNNVQFAHVSSSLTVEMKIFTFGYKLAINAINAIKNRYQLLDG